jgi:hypothetical protein
MYASFTTTTHVHKLVTQYTSSIHTLAAIHSPRIPPKVAKIKKL